MVKTYLIQKLLNVRRNIVNKDYQQGSRILYIFKKFNSELPYIEVWFADQSYKPLEIEHKINITLDIN